MAEIERQALKRRKTRLPLSAEKIEKELADLKARSKRRR
jgi:hypothetical protein